MVRGALRAELEAQRAPQKEKPFSDVSRNTAYGLLMEIEFVAVNGNEYAPEEAVVPQGTPSCRDFSPTSASGENANTPELLQHHRQQLQLLGIRFGRGGFNAYDARSRTHCSLAIWSAEGKKYSGIFDGCVAPYGLMVDSAVTNCRIVYEHKKALHDVEEGQAQAIMEVLAAYAYAPCPVLLDLTDGITHNLFTIRGNKLIIWMGLTSTAAYYMQAQHLKSLPNMEELGLTLDSIPEEQQKWLRNVRQKLRPSSGLREQLDSVVPFLPPDERPLAAFELIHTWAQTQQEAPPPPDFFC